MRSSEFIREAATQRALNAPLSQYWPEEFAHFTSQNYLSPSGGGVRAIYMRESEIEPDDNQLWGVTLRGVIIDSD